MDTFAEYRALICEQLEYKDLRCVRLLPRLTDPEYLVHLHQHTFEIDCWGGGKGGGMSILLCRPAPCCEILIDCATVLLPEFHSTRPKLLCWTASSPLAFHDRGATSGYKWLSPRGFRKFRNFRSRPRPAFLTHSCTRTRASISLAQGTMLLCLSLSL